MKIASVEALPLEIPFTHGGKAFGWGGRAWTRLSFLLVRVETDSGLVGYGEAFSYACRRAVQAALARTHGVEIMPHSRYFGPGFLASLQLAAALPEGALLERLYVDLEASLYGDLIDAVDGCFRVPDGPGLGLEPDAAVIESYRVRDP